MIPIRILTITRNAAKSSMFLNKENGELILVLSSRKGVELSLNTIIIAAIVIIVFFVLVYFVAEKMGYFSKEINRCENQEPETRASCLSKGGIPKGQFYTADGNKGEKDQVCCIIPK